IWTVRPDGSDLRVVNPTLDVRPGYLGPTRDGTAAVVPRDPRLEWVDLATGAWSPLETGCTNLCMYETHPSVSPDGSAVVFVRVSALGPDGTRMVITILDLRTQASAELQQTTIDEPAELCVDVTAACSIVGLEDPAIPPDGRRIAYTRIREIPGGSPDTRATVLFGEIVVGDIDGSNLRVLDLGGLPAGQPAWSPDGSRLLVSSNVQDHIGPGGGPMTQLRIRRNVFSVAADGSDLRQLTSDGFSTGASWTDDGRVRFLRIPTDDGNVQTSADFWLMNSDGSDQTQVTSFGPDIWGKFPPSLDNPAAIWLGGG